MGPFLFQMGTIRGGLEVKSKLYLGAWAAIAIADEVKTIVKRENFRSEGSP